LLRSWFGYQDLFNRFIPVTKRVVSDNALPRFRCAASAMIGTH
jgi:hypothetical protein